MTGGAWRVRGVRGATTVPENTKFAIAQATCELVQVLLQANQIQPLEIVTAIFTCTSDLNACFPSSTVREQLLGWEGVPLLDLAHLEIPGSLPHCIRVILQVNTPLSTLSPVYLRGAQKLRPDLLGAIPGTLC